MQRDRDDSVLVTAFCGAVARWVIMPVLMFSNDGQYKARPLMHIRLRVVKEHYMSVFFTISWLISGKTTNTLS